MSSTAVRVASAGVRAAASRLRCYAQCPAANIRHGEGWFAVATGVDSNDMNGVVSQPGTPISAQLIGELCDWFVDQAAPASWIIEGEPRTRRRARRPRGSFGDVGLVGQQNDHARPVR